MYSYDEYSNKLIIINTISITNINNCNNSNNIINIFLYV